MPPMPLPAASRDCMKCCGARACWRAFGASIRTRLPGQLEEIDRVYRAYPHLNDDAFVAEHRDEWLKE